MEKIMGVTNSEIMANAKPTEKKTKETRHHEKLSPSSFPAFDKCPCYKSSSSDGKSEALIKGTELHRQLQELLDSHEV